MANRYIDATLRFRDKFTGPMKKSLDKMQAQHKTIEKYGKNMQKTGKKISKVGSKMTRTLTVPLAGILGASGKAAMGFEKDMAKVATIADTTEVPISKLQNQILALSDKTGVAAGEIANQVYESISAGQKTGNAVNFVANSMKLAKSGFTSTGNAVDILTTVMNSYEMKAKDVTHVSDVLIQTQNLGKTKVDELAVSMGKVIPTAQAYSVSFEKVSAGYVTLTKNGIRTKFATTYLNSMLGELGKSGSKVSKILQNQTGHSFSELMKKGYSISDVLKIVKKGADKTGTKFSDLWGNSNSAKAAGTMLKHAEDYNSALKKLKNSAGSTDKAFKKMGGTDASKLNKAMNRMKNAAIRFGAPVMNIAAPAIEHLGKMAERLNNWLSKLSPSQQKFIVKMMATVAVAGPLLKTFGKLTSGVGSFISTIGKVGAGAEKLREMKTEGTGMFGMLGGMKTKVTALAQKIPILGKIGKIMFNPWVIAIAAVIGVLVVLYKKNKKFRESVHEIWRVVKKVGKWLWSGAKKIGPVIKKFVIFQIQLSIRVIKFLINIISKLVKVVVKVVSKIKKAITPIVKVVAVIVKKIHKILSSIINFVVKIFTGKWRSAWKDVVGIFRKVWNGIKSVAKAPINVVIGWINHLINALNKLNIKIPNKKWIPEKYRGESFGFHIANIPKLAVGTNNFQGGMALVGEQGPELVTMPKGAKVHTASETRKQLGSVHIAKLADQIIVREDADIDKIATALIRKLELNLDNVIW